MKTIVKKFLTGVPLNLVAAVVREHLLGTLKNPQSREYKIAQDELVELAKAVQAKWPERFKDEE